MIVYCYTVLNTRYMTRVYKRLGERTMMAIYLGLTRSKNTDILLDDSPQTHPRVNNLAGYIVFILKYGWYIQFVHHVTSLSKYFIG